MSMWTETRGPAGSRLLAHRAARQEEDYQAFATREEAERFRQAAALAGGPERARQLLREPAGLDGSARPQRLAGCVWLAEELNRRVRGLLDELARNALFPVRSRVARHLLDLATSEQEEPELRARATRQELADAVGTVREVVTRALTRLRDEGVVETERDVVRSQDPRRLHEIANMAG